MTQYFLVRFNPTAPYSDEHRHGDVRWVVREDGKDVKLEPLTSWQQYVMGGEQHVLSTLAEDGGGQFRFPSRMMRSEVSLIRVNTDAMKRFLAKQIHEVELVPIR